MDLVPSCGGKKKQKTITQTIYKQKIKIIFNLKITIKTFNKIYKSDLCYKFKSVVIVNV